jgi:hypothetical protein
MKQNITLSVDKDLIKKGKIIAAQKDTSVSKMLSEQLRRALQALKKGYHLGGKITWKRQDLYDR